MKCGLIGHTGFVGGMLAHLGCFTDFYNSHNYRAMAGQSFDRLVCCGIRAVKWWSNQNAAADWLQIQSLLDVLDQIECREFILISSIDVYPDTSSGEDESADLAQRDNHPYGRHRQRVEEWVARRFPRHHIVRLPALFGPDLKKNAIYDLEHGNLIDRIHPRSEFQWYPLTRLADDLEVAVRADLRTVNLFTEPVSMSRVVDECFSSIALTVPAHPPVKYRLVSRHAQLFGGRNGYLLNADEVLDELKDYLGLPAASVQ